MERSFKEYISNPLGNKNTVFSSREMYRNMYTEKFNILMVRENSKINYKLYKDAKNFYIHLNIPSEKVKNFYYDVFIQFIPTKTSVLERTLDNYTVRFYSNDPSFVYTFAHAFIKNGMFVEDLKPKMSKLAVRKNAVEKNPDNQIGYVKTLYFAYLFMKSRGLFNKVHYASATVYNKRQVLSEIMDADEKIQLRKEEAEALVKKPKKQDVHHDKRNLFDIGNNWNFTNRIKNVSTVNKVVNSVKSKFVGKTKTTKKF